MREVDPEKLLKDTMKLVDDTVKKAMPVIRKILSEYGIKDLPKVKVAPHFRMSIVEAITRRALAYGLYNSRNNVVYLNALRFTYDRINIANMLKSMESLPDERAEDVARELTIFSAVHTLLHEMYHFVSSKWKSYEELDWYEREEIESEADTFAHEWVIPVVYVVYGMDDRRMTRVVKYLPILFTYFDWLAEGPEEAVGYARAKLREIGYL